MEGGRKGGEEQGCREERKMKIWGPKEELEVKEHDTQGE